MKTRGASYARVLLATCCAVACNQPATPTPTAASAAPSASTSTSTPPPIEGAYRVDALLALNPKAVEAIGGPRVAMEESMRKSMEGGAFVFGRWQLRFDADKLTTRNDMVFKFQNGYQWTWCEAAGSATWRGKQLLLPGGLSSTGRNGFVNHDDSRSGNCNVNLAAGTFTLEQQGGETRLHGFHDGADFAFILVKDDTDPDVEARARALAGNPKK